MTFALAALIVFAVSFLVAGFIASRMTALIPDVPNERSSHSGVKPRGGGLGFILALAVLPLLAEVTSIGPLPYRSLALVLLPLVLIGLFDDLRHASVGAKFAVQLIAAACALYFFYPSVFHGAQPWPAAALCAAAVVMFLSYVNFYNFMDGIDGLVGSCSALQLAFLGWYFNLGWMVLAAVAVCGFLYWNWQPARVFMGDCGSMFLGGLLAIGLFHACSVAEVLVVFTVTLPILADAAYTVLRRLKQRGKLTVAHRNHIYQRLTTAGLSHASVTLAYLMLNLCLIGVTFLPVSWVPVAAGALLIAAIIGAEALMVCGTGFSPRQ